MLDFFPVIISWFKDKSISWTILVSSANSFSVNERLLPRSKYIRKNNHPKKEPSGIRASDSEDAWPIKRTRCNLPFKKLLISFRSVPEIPVDWIL